ncbi:P-loop containing nucleoside triphosphate hydrolase protein [Lactarius deliciosus]|nr:P-loop containing nucleoside triphosphate hydrolase protein [Lactarius deliciosus]
MAVVQRIRQLELFRAVGIDALAGIPLWGPSGCGKTLLAKVVANESQASTISVKGPEFLNKDGAICQGERMGGAASVRVSSPCIIFFDEFDALVRGATNSTGSMCVRSSSVRRTAGIIAVKRIFKNILDPTIVPGSSLPAVETDAPMQIDADAATVSGPPTPSPESLPFVQPAAASLLTHSPIARLLQSHPGSLTPALLAPLFITTDDFMLALKEVQPSAMREGFATIPDVAWADPIHRPELFRAVGIDAPTGVLLWGPPGCGKTLLAKAVANESQASFISVKGPESLNKYVGESERAVRQVFARARASSPCIIFFDELDALVSRRDEALSESARVVNTLLTELDGLDARRGVFVLGATNRLDMLDPAMCRPGWLDKLLYVDLPSPDERTEIVRTACSPWRPACAVCAFCARAGGQCRGDAAPVREAGVRALRRALGTLREMDDSPAGPESGPEGVVVLVEDFQAAQDKVVPRVSKVQRRRYEYRNSDLVVAINTKEC